MSDALTLAAELCRRWEGFKSKPYLCPAGVPTIGYGTTAYPDGRKVSLADVSVTREQAEAYLLHELRGVSPAVLRLCPVLLLEVDPKLAAILDFTYNLGAGRLQTSTLRRKINARDWPGVAEQLRRWVRGGGRVLPGLVARREDEIRLLGLADGADSR